MRVYASIDPVTKRRHDLIEIVPPGPNAEKTARDVRDRLVREVAERRNPRTSATVDQLLERHLDQFDGAPNTLTLYRGYVRNHISPCLGHFKVGQVDAETLDSFLRRATPLPSALLQPPPGDRPPDAQPSRVRRPMWAAPMPSAEPDDGPAYALHPLWRVQACHALVVGLGQPDRAGRTARDAEAES